MSPSKPESRLNPSNFIDSKVLHRLSYSIRPFRREETGPKYLHPSSIPTPGCPAFSLSAFTKVRVVAACSSGEFRAHGIGTPIGGRPAREEELGAVPSKASPALEDCHWLYARSLPKRLAGSRRRSLVRMLVTGTYAGVRRALLAPPVPIRTSPAPLRWPTSSPEGRV